MDIPLPHFIKKYIVSDDEVDLTITSLQGTSSSSSAEGKQMLIFIGPIWLVFIINSFINPYLSSLGYDAMMLYILSMVFTVLALVGPIVTFQIIKVQKIQYLAGRDKYKNIFGWNPEDFDISDMASRSDPVRISIGGNLETESFIDNVKMRMGEIKLTEASHTKSSTIQGGN